MARSHEVLCVRKKLLFFAGADKVWCDDLLLVVTWYGRGEHISGDLKKALEIEGQLDNSLVGRTVWLVPLTYFCVK